MRQFQIRSAGALCAGICVVILAIVGNSSADIDGAINGNEYAYQVTGLPDFDQQRQTAPGIPGLPNDGKMYCVPSSTMDLLAYAANHGFPEVLPGPGFWQSNALYNPATATLAALGQQFFTNSTTGTNSTWWYKGLAGSTLPFIQPWLPMNKFTVTLQIKDGSYVPKIDTVVKTTILHNGLTAICHGWYDTFDFGGQTYISRDGGHCMALQAAALIGPNGDVILRDPADDNGNFTTQSQFAKAKFTAQSQSVCVDLPPPFCLSAVMTKLTPHGASTSNRYLDKYLMIATKGAYSFSDDLQLINFAKAFKFGNGGAGEPDEGTFVSLPIMQGLGDLVDAVMSPDMDSIYYIAGVRVLHLDLATSQSQVVATPNLATPTKIIFGRHRNLYALDGEEVICINIDGPAPVETAIAVPPNPCHDIFYDDVNDHVVLLDAINGQLVKYPYILDGEPTFYDIPPAALPGGPVHLAISPVDGIAWLLTVDGDDPILQKLTITPDGEVIAQAIGLPAVQNPTGLEIDDTGHIFVLHSGGVSEFRIAGEKVIPIPDSLFADMPAHGIFRVTHSRTNFIEGVHDTREWRDVLPDEFAPIELDCAADIVPVDGNGVVNVDDLLAVINAWSACADPGNCPADVAPTGGNGVVNVDDLLAVINAWGECP